MKHLDFVKETAEKATLTGGGHAPMLFAFTSKSEMAGVLFEKLPQDSEQKRMMMAQAGHKVGEETRDLAEVYFVSEAWYSKPKKGQKIQQPSKDPNCMEALIINCCDLGAADPHSMLMYEMIRDKNGDLAQLKSVNEFEKEGGKFESPLMDSFLTGYKLGAGFLNKADNLK